MQRYNEYLINFGNNCFFLRLPNYTIAYYRFKILFVTTILCRIVETILIENFQFIKKN